MRLSFSGILLASVAAWAQTSAPRPEFEVASIKASPPPDGRGMRIGVNGGPGSGDPGRWSTENMSLSNLVTYAYDLKRHEYQGLSWMDKARFDIQAKVSAGATKDDLKLMVRAMLEERFKLAFHREKKEMAGFELVVAKGGP